jgi:hypothetical protein
MSIQFYLVLPDASSHARKKAARTIRCKLAPSQILSVGAPEGPTVIRQFANGWRGSVGLQILTAMDAVFAHRRSRRSDLAAYLQRSAANRELLLQLSGSTRNSPKAARKLLRFHLTESDSDSSAHALLAAIAGPVQSAIHEPRKSESGSGSEWRNSAFGAPPALSIGVSFGAPTNELLIPLFESKSLIPFSSFDFPSEEAFDRFMDAPAAAINGGSGGNLNDSPLHPETFFCRYKYAR